jgi:hypothetical protein
MQDEPGAVVVIPSIKKLTAVMADRAALRKFKSASLPTSALTLTSQHDVKLSTVSMETSFPSDPMWH